jgi:soluble lytic murein transglycosylase
MRFLVVPLLLFASCVSAAAADPATHRAEFKRALEIAERGPPSDYAGAARALADHPLAAYLEYAYLRRQLDRIDAAPVRRFLQRHADLPIATTLRDAWLHALIRRKDWAAFRAFYVERGDLDLRCAALHARLIAGTDADFLDDAQALWLSGTSLPALCDPSFVALRVARRITLELVWRRIDLAIDADNAALVRFLARDLPGAQRTRAEAYAAFLASPSHTGTLGWPRDARSARVATHALQRLAQRDPDAAEALFAALATPLKLAPEQRGAVLNQIALWSAASYLPASAARFARVPAEAFDARLHEWRAREALARGDLAAVRGAIAAMPAEQREEGRWRYIDARLRPAAERAVAHSAFAALATEPNYYGFLAADRLDLPYALCPLDPAGDAAQRKRVAELPGLVRALELHALDRPAWALREWDAAIAGLDAEQRRIAVDLADAEGWYDRAVFTLNSGDDLRYYALRFPLPHARHLRAEARRHGLDPAWVAALIRAESAWQAQARSHADARGLMQLLPGTAREEARRRGLPWRGASALYQPLTNITLGTAHLQEMLQRHDGRPYLATAAYNAGPQPVARWLAQRAPREPDLWIETIPYRETRDYVSRILAFSVVYDWRLQRDALPVTRRMLGDAGRRATRRDFACPSSPPVASTP